MDQSATTYPFKRREFFKLPEEFAWLQRNAPVAQVTMADGRKVWVVTRYEDVKAALSDPRFTRRLLNQGTPPAGTAGRNGAGAGAGGDNPGTGGPGNRQGAAKPRASAGSSMSIAQPPGHTRWRRIVNKAFSVRRAESMRPRIGELVDQVLDDMAARPRPVDFMEAFAFPLPLLVICELFGVPEQDRPQVREWAGGLRSASGSLAGFGAAMQALGAYATELVAQRRREPGTDALSVMMTTPDDDGSLLSDDELVQTLMFLAVAGYETPAVQFGNSLFALFLHPKQLDRLRQDPDLISTAVEEFLRYAQAGTGFAGATFATEDVELGGVTIPAGSTVYVSVDCANRDETYFPCPESFDLDRAAARKHVAFSSGPHFCLGAALARVELQEGLGRLLRRFPALQLVTAPGEVELVANPFSHYPRVLPVTW